ncbi:anthrone oxygenase family protein [Blastococcus sp. SYSU D00820]
MTGTAVVVAAAVGSGLVAGVFLAFSGFVMRALGSLPPAAGAAAMRAVNVAAVRPPLMTALFGTALLHVVAAIGVLAGGPLDRSGVLVLAGAVAYLAGLVGVTAVANVPLNDRLAATEPGSADEAASWARYTRRWTRWNTVRTVAGTVAAAAMAVSLAG